MSGHHPWRQLKRTSVTRTWEVTLRNSYRPWWGLGLIHRWHEIHLAREGTEEEVLASLADLTTQFPHWDFELHRAS
jgi:hypothetical protein